MMDISEIKRTEEFPFNEIALSLKEARRHFVGSPSDRTISYWMRMGVISSNGTRVFLESFKEGGRRFTTVEAVMRFKRRVNGFDDV